MGFWCLVEERPGYSPTFLFHGLQKDTNAIQCFTQQFSTPHITRSSALTGLCWNHILQTGSYPEDFFFCVIHSVNSAALDSSSLCLIHHRKVRRDRNASAQSRSKQSHFIWHHISENCSPCNIFFLQGPIISFQNKLGRKTMEHQTA